MFDTMSAVNVTCILRDQRSRHGVEEVAWISILLNTLKGLCIFSDVSSKL